MRNPPSRAMDLAIHKKTLNLTHCEIQEMVLLSFSEPSVVRGL